jgi:hypothetical protein
MKRFHVFFLIVFFTGAVLATAQAQKKPGQGGADPKQRAEQTVTRLKEGGLALTDDTWAKVQTVYEESFTKAEGSGKPDREQMQKQREETSARLKAILTEEQYKKLEEIERSAGPGGRKDGGGKGAQHKKPQ